MSRQFQNRFAPAASTVIRALVCACVLALVPLGQVTAQDRSNFAQAAKLYEDGKYEESLRLFVIEAIAGSTTAQFNVGFILDNGIGVSTDKAAAEYWYRQAAQSGYVNAQTNLGLLLLLSGGSQQKVAEAAYWTILAAEQGNMLAQANLARMYGQGQGVPEDYVVAYKWANLAAANGNQSSRKDKEWLRARMSALQIAEAQRLSGDWSPKSLAEQPKLEDRASEVSGSGFLVVSPNILVTNAHVVEGCKSIRTGSGGPLSLAAIDKTADLALLRSNLPLGSPLVIRSRPLLALGEDLTVAGFPLPGLVTTGLTVTAGTVSALAGPNDNRSLFQLTAPIQPGNSGGPVFDVSGNVVGVVVSKLDSMAIANLTGDIPQNVNFAITPSTLESFLQSAGVTSSTRPADHSLSRVQVAALAGGATFRVICSQ